MRADGLTPSDRNRELKRRYLIEGRWDEVLRFKRDVTRELKASGVPDGMARYKAWEETARMFPPLAESRPIAEENGVVVETPVQPVVRIQSGPAPPADLPADIRWVYAHLDDKKTQMKDAPSKGAWSLLVWARNYQSRFFEHLLPKALAKSPEDEEGVRRERASLAEIESLLDKLAEDE
jgi:hypothetical protein